MRIGLVTPGFSASEDDWCIPVLLDLVRKLVAAGNQVTVIALRYPHHCEPYRVYGAEVIPLGGAERRGVSRLVLLARSVVELIALHRRQRFSVLHGIWAHEPGLVVSLTGKLTGVPTLVSVFGGELVGFGDIGYGGQLHRSNRWACRVALRMADRIAFGSRIQQQLIQKAVADDHTRLEHAPLGVDTELFSRGSPGALQLDGRPTLVTVGSLVPVKDHTTLFRAFARVSARLPEARLHIFGDGPLRGRLVQLAAELDVADAIRFHGEVRRETLREVFTSADAAIVSSRSEHIPMVCLEAMACGCPVVGTAVGILPELEHVVPVSTPGDPVELADSMIEVLDAEQAPARRRLGSNLIEQRFSLDHSVERHLQIYRELAEEIDLDPRETR